MGSDPKTVLLANLGALSARVEFYQQLSASHWSRIAELEARIRELTEWRPMETAPMDGSRFVALLRWRGDGPVEERDTREIASWWDEDARPGENDFCDDRGDPIDNEYFEFIGWLPLPAPLYRRTE